MGAVDTIRDAWRIGGEQKILDVGQPSGGVETRWWISRAGYMRQLRDVGSGSSSSIVVSALRVWTDSFTEAPVAVYEDAADGTPTIVPDHPLAELIDRPNPAMISDMLWQYYLWATRIDGNAYLYKVRSAAGRVVELWPLRPDLVDPKRRRDSGNLIDYYEYRPMGTAVELDPSDVVHLRIGLDPNDHARGLAPIKVVLKEILGDEEASRMTSALLSNMGIPGVILSPSPGELGPNEAQSDRIRDRWRQRFGGDRRGEPLVLNGAMTVETIAFSPQELDLKALRRVPEERITAVLGVPAILAGLGAGLEASSGRSESVTLVELFTERVVMPEWRRVARWLTWELLPEFETSGRRYVGFDTTAVAALEEDRNELWSRVDSAIRSGWLSVAEGKRLVGLEPGDADDVYLRSMSVEAIPVDYEAPPPPLPVASPNGQIGVTV